MLCLGKRADCSVPKSKEHWRLPEEGWVKVNTYGSFDACMGHGAGAAVLHGHHGEVCAAQVRCFGPVHEALVADAIAAHDGLMLAAQQGYTQVILESDSVVLVVALNSSTLDRSVVGGICHDIRELSRSFSSFQVCFVRREANSLADRCVKEVSVESPVKIWNCFPQWLKEAAALDCNPAME
jgi:ribonuclease HI